ncbi:MAG TPA: DsrE family protein [Vicinamibacterales bacterium]|nr:DsrE family protein [Vicinamibacterales bacterium]
MTHRVLRFASILIVLLGCAATTRAQSTRPLPVPGVDPARDVPGAKELPDPKVEYKVLFDAAAAPAKPGDVNPMLQTVARYVNTLVKFNVPADHRKIAVVFHQGSTLAILKNDAYKARNDGQDNPNIAMIQALAKAGVAFHVCGQAVLGQKIDPKDIQPEIQLDLWALTTIVNFEQRGYVRIGG